MATATTLVLEPAPNIGTHWTVPTLRAALTQHELGDFSLSGLLAEHIRRDPTVFHALDTRVLGMLGLPFAIEPSDDGDQRKAGKVAADVRLWWRRKIRKSQLAKILRWGILMGFCPGTLRWEDDAAGRQLPRPRVYHPQWSRWNQFDRRWELSTARGQRVPIETGTGDFFLYAPGGDDQPWMEGAVRALAIPWLIRSMAERDWARASEVYGLGIRKVRVPDDATKQEAIRRFFADVRNLANEPNLKIPEGFDLEVAIVTASDGSGFQKLINLCEAAIVSVILGQLLTTQSSGGGSYALGKVQQRVQLDRYEADVENLGDFVQEQILAPYCERNEGDRELAPRPYWDTDPPEDKAVLATRMMSIATAIRTFKDAGIPIDVRALCEQLELPLLAAVEGEDQRRGQLRDIHFKCRIPRLNEARADAGLPPVSDEEGGNDFVKEGGNDGQTADEEPAPEPFPPPMAEPDPNAPAPVDGSPPPAPAPVPPEDQPPTAP